MYKYKALKWFGMVLIAILALLVLAWSIARMNGPSVAQEQALALMQQPWEPEGDNAFGALWLLPYDVPEDELEALAARDMARMRATASMTEDGGGGLVDFVSEAASLYPDQTPSGEDRERFCKPRGDDCLARVRSDLDGYRALLARHAPLLDRVERLQRHDHARNLFPRRIDAPFLHFTSGSFAMTRHALLFAEGEVDPALDAACRDFSTWRRLGTQTDMLILAMVGDRYSSDGLGRLIAGMLSELPLEHPLPASCRVALQPSSVHERSICTAMRGEFVFSDSVVKETMAQAIESADASQRWAARVFLNPRKVEAHSAERFASVCLPEEAERIAVDLPVAPKPADTMLHTLRSRFDCIDNVIGCILTGIAAPAYDDYRHRMQDFGARMQVLATLVWLREQDADGRSLQALLAARPAELKGTVRDVEPGEGGRTLGIRLHDHSRGDHWEIPLPTGLADLASPSRQAGTGSAAVNPHGM